MNFTLNPYMATLSAQLNQGTAVTPPPSQPSSSNKRIRILPDSFHLDNCGHDGSTMEVEPKNLHETQTSSSKSLKEVNEQIKHEVQRLKKQCSDLKVKSKPDDPNVHWFRDQLVFERVKVRRALVEIYQLKAEFEGLKIKCSEQKIKIEYDDFKIRWLQDQLNAERDKVIRVSGEEDHLKILLKRLEKKCCEQKFKMESDASKVYLLQDQLLSERAKVKRELGGKNKLKAELEGLQQQCSEQNIKMESDAFNLRQLEVHLNVEKAKVERVLEEKFAPEEQFSLLVCRLEDERNMERANKNGDLDESRAYAPSLSDLAASLCKEKDKLSLTNEVAEKKEVTRELQSSMKGLEKKITIAMEREVANVTESRKDGYSDGVREGRRMGWRESVEWCKRESSQPQNPTQGM